MSFYVQQQSKVGNWVSEDYEFLELEDARRHANSIYVGSEPRLVRVVNDQTVVCAWVPRNGYKMSDVLPPGRRS
jgi:hypothetical protein